MKKLTLAIVIFCCFSSNCQNELTTKNPIIKLKEFYDKEGVVFTEDPNICFRQKAFIPTIEELVKGERILSHLVSMGIGSRGNLRDAARQKMRTLYRQYAGLINERNEKMLVIILLELDNDNPDYLNRRFYNEISLLSCYSDINILFRTVIINLNNKELDEGSDILTGFFK